MRLIDADKINPRDVIGGESEFANDIRKAMQDLVDSQPTAYDANKIINELEKEFKKYYGTNWDEAPYLVRTLEIIKVGGENRKGRCEKC